MDIIEVGISDSLRIIEIENLARAIWSQHYTPIIGASQVEYMVNNFQSFDAIKKQISEGLEYYLVVNNDNAIGYFAFKLASPDEIFLSKIYISNSQRGKGVGKFCFDFIKSRACALNAKIISLTVNKYNHNSYNAYQAWGFRRTGETVQDIGNGFVMDDWIYTLELNETSHLSN
jgi:GNAT superfamily N-acetyltransferase